MTIIQRAVWLYYGFRSATGTFRNKSFQVKAKERVIRG